MRNLQLVFLLLIEFDSIGGCVILLLMEHFEICLSIQYYYFIFCSSISQQRGLFSYPHSTSDLDAHNPSHHCNPVSLTTMHVYIFWLFCSPNKAQIIHISSRLPFNVQVWGSKMWMVVWLHFMIRYTKVVSY